MKIHLTERAIAQLSIQLNSDSFYLCLDYEVGGCGSSLDGTIRMRWTSMIPKNYVSIDTNGQSIYMEQSTLKFLDTCLTIDYQSSGFMIKSNHQIYSYFLTIDKEDSNKP